MNKIISIVTPSLNQGQYIEETIKSVLKQKGDFFIDYIVSDGGSTDDTVNIVRKYERLLDENKIEIKCKGVSLTWWSESDNGQTNALNKGFKRAKGDICAWINSDDFYEESAFQTVFDNFKKDKSIDLLYGDGYVLNDNLGIKYLQKSEEVDFEKLLRRGCLIFQPSAFFHKRVLMKFGFLDESFDYVMDYDLWLKISREGKLAYVQKIFSNFRVWGESKTNLHNKMFKQERRILYKRYGGNIIDYGTIGEIREKMKIFNILKKYFPNFYISCKKMFYSFVDMFHYKEK